MNKILALAIVLSVLLASVQSQAFLKKEQEMKNFQKHLHKHDQTQNNSTEPLEVHLIPHSHDDVGWLKTVDEYFYGYRNDIQLAGVQYTIEGVVTELLLDPKKTFVYVEMAFFYRWYKNQNQDKKDQVKGLVDNGQLEFINGGVCMNDEAAPYYEDMIDQMTWGHQFLQKEFQVAPTIGWQIDPFGHSATQARLFYEMGFDGWFFARIDHQDKDNRMNNRNLECIVNPVSDAKQNKPIFTATLYQHYESPRGFGFDVGQRDDPIMYDKSLEYFNLEQKATDFVNYFRQMQTHYKQNILMHTMGSDFQYMDAKMNFMNIDRLIDFINLPENVVKYQATIKYSTVSRYLERINSLNMTSYQTKTDDFFPYASDTSDYWTGYFTSRVNSKLLIRETGRFLQNARSMLSNLTYVGQLDQTESETAKSLVFDLEHFMGIVQHHDAVSGTEREAVNQDYSRLLTKARDHLQQYLEQVFRKLSNQVFNIDFNQTDFHFCQWNQTSSDCGVFHSDQQVLLTVHNPIQFFNPQVMLQVKVDHPNYNVSQVNGRDVQSEVICSDHYDNHNCVLYIYTGLDTGSFSFFLIQPSTESSNIITKSITNNYLEQQNDFNLSINEYRSFNWSSKGQQISFDLEYLYYKSYQGNGHRSGAYAFRPDQSDATGVPYSNFNRANIQIGNMVVLVQLFKVDSFNNLDIVTQIRFYKVAVNETEIVSWNGLVEIETFVNSINIEDGQGKEVIMRVTNKNIKNDGVFYTDSNGLEMQQRIRNHRDTWEWDRDELVTGNYYPVNAIIGIEDKEDKEQGLFIVNDRSQGGSSIRDGEVEVMIHRRILYDDNKGVCEPLNEKGLDGKGMKTTLRHYLFTSLAQARQFQYLIDLQPIQALSSIDSTQLHYTPKSYLSNDFTQTTHQPFTKFYMMYDQQHSQQFFFRLQNAANAQDSQIRVQADIQELSLTTNMDKATMEKRRMKWNYTPSYTNNNNKQQQIPHSLLLNLLEIRTFSIQKTQTHQVSK